MTTDDSWFDSMVGDHGAILRNYVARRVPAHDVDDVVSEVLTAAWRHRARRPPEPRLWLLRCAANVLLHEYRSQRRRERLKRRVADHLTIPAGPDTRALESDAAQTVRVCLAQLAHQDRELLRLTYWDQLSSDEAAFVLGTTAVAARVRLHRARRRLAALLPAWLDPPGTHGTEPASATASIREARS